MNLLKLFNYNIKILIIWNIFQIPTPPQLESDFVVVDISDCAESGGGSPEELIETLEKDLVEQIEVIYVYKYIWGWYILIQGDI